MSRKSKDEPSIKVEDRRHWAREDQPGQDEATESSAVSTEPSIVEELRRRADEAESRLQEYIEAFKQAQADQEKHRVRLERDVDRRVELKFGTLVTSLLGCVDDLDRALDHADGSAGAEPLARGVALVRERFLSALEECGVTRLLLDGEPFDPNLAEATRVDPVEDAGLEGTVTETVRPGYRLGDRIIRPASVAVGKRIHRS